jgi:hypothetical protein
MKGDKDIKDIELQPRIFEESTPIVSPSERRAQITVAGCKLRLFGAIDNHPGYSKACFATAICVLIGAAVATGFVIDHLLENHTDHSNKTRSLDAVIAVLSAGFLLMVGLSVLFQIAKWCGTQLESIRMESVRIDSSLARRPMN